MVESFPRCTSLHADIDDAPSMWENLVARLIATLAKLGWSFGATWLQKRQPPAISVKLGSDGRFFRERSEWSNSARATIITARLGLINRSRLPLRVRTVVEKAHGYIEPRTEKPLQVSDAPKGADAVTVPPGAEPLVFVDLVDHYQESHYAFICFANPSHEDMLPRRCRLDLRFQTDTGVVGRTTVLVRTHRRGGIPMKIEVLPL